MFFLLLLPLAEPCLAGVYGSDGVELTFADITKSGLPEGAIFLDVDQVLIGTPNSDGSFKIKIRDRNRISPSPKEDFVTFNLRPSSGTLTPKKEEAPNKGSRLYLDRSEANQAITVLSEPSPDWADWHDCEATQLCKAWPNQKAELYLQDMMLVETRDKGGQWKWTLFYKISYDYTHDGKRRAGVGWVRADDVRAAPPNVPKPTEAGTCALCTGPAPKKSPVPKESGGEIKESASRWAKELLVNKLLDHVGKCYGSPAVSTRTKFKKVTKEPYRRPPIKTKFPFDEYIRDQWSHPNEMPRIDAEKGPLSRDQLLAIDAVARTLFAEMEECSVLGPQDIPRYPLVVAATVQNRARKILDMPQNRWVQRQYGRGEHSAGKKYSELLLDVVSSNEQYSSWNHWASNNRLGAALCPANARRGTFWEGEGKIQKEPSQAWQKSVEIAADMVLNPDEFSDAVKDLSDIYLFTSRIARNDGSTEVSRSLLGFPLNHKRCVRLWQGKKWAGKKQMAKVKK